MTRKTIYVIKKKGYLDNGYFLTMVGCSATGLILEFCEKSEDITAKIFSIVFSFVAGVMFVAWLGSEEIKEEKEAIEVEM